MCRDVTPRYLARTAGSKNAGTDPLTLSRFLLNVGASHVREKGSGVENVCFMFATEDRAVKVQSLPPGRASKSGPNLLSPKRKKTPHLRLSVANMQTNSCRLKEILKTFH